MAEDTVAAGMQSKLGAVATLLDATPSSKVWRR